MRQFASRRGFAKIGLAVVLLASVLASAPPASADGPSFTATVKATNSESVTFTIRETTPDLAIASAAFEPTAPPPPGSGSIDWIRADDGASYAIDHARSAVVRWRPGQNTEVAFTNALLANQSAFLAATTGNRFAVREPLFGGGTQMNVLGPDGQPVTSPQWNVEAAHFLAGGQSLLVRQQDQRLVLWDLSAKTVRPVGHSVAGQWASFAVAPSGRFLAVSGHAPHSAQQHGVWVRDLSTGSETFYATSRAASPWAFSGMDDRHLSVSLVEAGFANIDRATGAVSQPYFARSTPRSISTNGRFGQAAVTEATGLDGYALFEVTDLPTGQRRTFRVDTNPAWRTVAGPATISNDGLTVEVAISAFKMQNGMPSGGWARLRGTLQLQPPPFDARYGDVLRLYRAFFQREPDRDGAYYWTGHHAAGLSLGAIADSFVASREFAAAYQGTDDPAYVDRVYRNVMGREPDPEGRAYWIDKLARRVITRGGLMVNFSVSEEFRGRYPYRSMPR